MLMRWILVTVAILGLALSASVGFAQKKPPPKDGDACSPGFWKNHQELWVGECCEEGEQCDTILANLRAKGPGGNVFRSAAADFLEECLGRPCND